MQKVMLKKVYVSILIVALCFITLGATTFAWVGIFTNASFDNFEINLNSSKLEEYGIEISLTGEEGTFGSTVDTKELKRIILKNFGYSDSYLDKLNQNRIDDIFGQSIMVPCTVVPNSDNTFPTFKNILEQDTTGYYKFDLYVSAFKAYESDTNEDFFIDLYLNGDLLEGTVSTCNLINKFTYPSNFVNNEINGILAGTEIKNNIQVNSASAARVSIQKYNVVTKGKPEEYEQNSIINDLIIYQDGSILPVYDPINNVYSFGGILEEEYNLALSAYNNKFPWKRKELSDELLNRGDIQYSKSNLNQIIDSSNVHEKVGINSMIKLTICFWFEGYDSDCFEVIEKNPVTLNLNLSLNPDET